MADPNCPAQDWMTGRVIKLTKEEFTVRFWGGAYSDANGCAYPKESARFYRVTSTGLFGKLHNFKHLAKKK